MQPLPHYLSKEKEESDYLASMSLLNVRVQHKNSLLGANSMMEMLSDRSFVMGFDKVLDPSGANQQTLRCDPQKPLMTEAAEDYSKERLQEDFVQLQSRVPNMKSKLGSFRDDSLPVFESQVLSTQRMCSPRLGQDASLFEQFRLKLMGQETEQREDFRLPQKHQSSEITTRIMVEEQKGLKTSVVHNAGTKVSSISFRGSVKGQLAKGDLLKEKMPYYETGPGMKTDLKKVPTSRVQQAHQSIIAPKPIGTKYVVNRGQIDLLRDEDSEEQTIENFNCQISQSSKHEKRVPAFNKVPSPMGGKNYTPTSYEIYETSKDQIHEQNAESEQQPIIEQRDSTPVVVEIEDIRPAVGSRLFVQSKVFSSCDSDGDMNIDDDEIEEHLPQIMNEPSSIRKSKFQREADNLSPARPLPATSMRGTLRPSVKEQSLVTFYRPCRATYQKDPDSSAVALPNRFVTLQTNQKLVIFASSENSVKSPLAPTDQSFIDKLNGRKDVSKEMMAYALKHYHKADYLKALKDIGSIEQTNVCSSCNPEYVLDLGLLGPGRIFNESKVFNSRYDQPLVQLDRDDCFENPDKAVSLYITIYKAQQANILRSLRSFSSSASESRSIFQIEEEEDRANQFIDVSSPRKKESDMDMTKYLKMKLTLTFDDYASMITLFQALEDLLEQQQEEAYRLQRLNYDGDFWRNLRAYQRLYTSQVESWRFNSISEEMFLRHVDTGDILLFRTNSKRAFGSWVTRTVTNSHFDHIALVLRFGDSLNELFLMEAVGDQGVRMTSWINVREELYPGGFFEKILTRKLICHMSNEMLDRLDQFRKNALGHSYGLNALQVALGGQSFVDEGQSHAQIEKDRKFFCSELVAKAYKALGVIQDISNRSSCTFYPSSFAPREHGGHIDNIMAPETTLGPALNIMVNSGRTYHAKTRMTNIRRSMPFDFRPSRVSIPKRESDPGSLAASSEHFYCREPSAEDVSYGNTHNCWI